MAATTHDPSASRAQQNQAPGTLRHGVFGPTVAGGKPRDGGPDWLRVAGLAMSLVLAFVLATGGYYGVLLWQAQQDVGDIALDDVAGDSGFSAGEGADQPLQVPEPVVLEDRKTILLVGSDSRDGLSREQLNAIGTDNVGTDLTDTIIVLQIDPNTDAATMLSFPRDLLVERCDGSRGKINEAFFIGEQQREGGGAQCLIDTITALTQIHIDHYARINFAGFVEAVDALGGVTFYVQEPLRDRFSGLDVPSGCVDFDGVTAIQFVRARHIDSDFGRIARQQRFAREMIKKATSVGTLLNPARVTSLVRSVARTLETDTQFGAGEMIDLVNSVRGISSGSVDGRTVPGIAGPSVVRLIEDDAEALFTAFRNGELLPDGIGLDAGPIALTPANVIPVEISNGAAPEGTAEETQTVLEALGFSVSGTGQTDNYGFNGSVIFHPADRADHARLLAEALGGVQVSERGDGVDGLKLVLGRSFDPAAFAPEPPPPTEAGETPTPTTSPTEEVFAGAELSDVSC